MSASTRDADLQLTEQSSQDRNPNSYSTRVAEADTHISYGIGGAGNLRRSSQNASAREELTELRQQRSQDNGKSPSRSTGETTLFKSTTGQDATGEMRSGEFSGGAISGFVGKVKEMLH